MESQCTLTADKGVKDCEGIQSGLYTHESSYDKGRKSHGRIAAGRSYIPVPALLTPGLMTAAIMLLLWDSSLPDMTECWIAMVMVKLAPCAAMTVVMALPRRYHGRQHLPQPSICSLYCLHNIMLIEGIADTTCSSEPHASQASKGLSLDTPPARLQCLYCSKHSYKPQGQQAREVGG